MSDLAMARADGRATVDLAIASKAVAGVAHVRGFCDGGWRDVLDTFVANFVDDVELGASVAIEVDGRNVLDLWGGWIDADARSPWRSDTLGVVFSNTKPATALCAHILVDAGALDLDKRVAHYWPGFERNGKDDVTVRMLLDHSAGLPALSDPLPDGAAFDWDLMTARLAAQTPFWKPGTRVGYHGLTFGWLVGEVVRRVAGRSLGTFFDERVARPLGLDFWIGLPEREEHRVAAIIPAPPPTAPRNPFERAVVEERDSVSALYFRNTGGWRPLGFNTRVAHAAEIGAAGGITNARSLARLYGTLSMGGSRDGIELLSTGTLNAAIEITSATHEDVCLRVPTRFGAGFMRTMDNRARDLDSARIGADGFGHVGAGGSLGFASMKHRLGFGYTMNRMGHGVLLNGRGQRLADAAYRVLERSASTTRH